MKKIAIAIAILMVASSFAMAAEATVTGDATLTWGLDFQAEATGFTNDSSVTIEIPLVAKASEENTADAVYGSIKLADFSAVVDADGLAVVAPTVTASILLSDVMSVKIFGAPSYGTGMAAGFATLIDVRDEEDAPDAVEADLTDYNGGFTFMYDLGGMGSASVSVASEGNWDSVDATTIGTTDGIVYLSPEDGVDLDDDDDNMYYQVDVENIGGVMGSWTGGDTIPEGTYYYVVAAADGGTAANTQNKYNSTVALSLTPMDMIALDLSAGYGWEKDIAFSAKVKVMPMDMISLWASSDLAFANGNSIMAFDSDVAGGLNVDLGMAALTSSVYFAQGSDLDLNVGVSVSAVENLTLGGAYEMYMWTGKDNAFTGNAAYDLGGIKPYVAGTVYNEADVQSYSVNAGVEFASLIENTVVKVDYLSEDIMADKGDLEVSCKIAF